MRNRALISLVGAAALLTVAACGTSDPPAGDSDGSGETRTIEHAMGTTEVPVEPKRIVVLDTDKIDTLLTLGVTPVGAATPDETGLPSYLGDLSDVTLVGTLTAPDTEAIEDLNPDLILGTKFRQEEFYDELSAIAATVFTEMVGITWKENFLLDGDAIGKGDEAKELLATYEQRASDFGATFPDPASIEISIVRFMPDHVRVYGPESFSGIVVADTGLGRPPMQQLADADDKRHAKISPERIDEADGDVLFYCAYGEAAADAQAQVLGGELWTGMSAVQDGHAYEVDDEIWMTGIGITAANLILDDLQEYVPAP